ncbi:hypothetical protein BVI434_180068 [Burkholderia vietnamiensis]|nr:hypothetical protein BVI434_180068 [Burkholderia vietnamiensis]
MGDVSRRPPEGCNRLLAVIPSGRGKCNSVLRTAGHTLKAQGDATGGFSVRRSHGKEQNDEQNQSQAGGG